MIEDNNEKFSAVFNINSEGFFKLNIDHNLVINGATQEDVVEKLLNTLKNAQVLSTTDGTIRFGSGENAKNDIIEYWTDLRDSAVMNLEEGEEYIFLGHEDQLEIEIVEN